MTTDTNGKKTIIMRDTDDVDHQSNRKNSLRPRRAQRFVPEADPSPSTIRIPSIGICGTLTNQVLPTAVTSWKLMLQMLLCSIRKNLWHVDHQGFPSEATSWKLVLQQRRKHPCLRRPRYQRKNQKTQAGSLCYIIASWKSVLQCFRAPSA